MKSFVAVLGYWGLRPGPAFGGLKALARSDERIWKVPVAEMWRVEPVVLTVTVKWAMSPKASWQPHCSLTYPPTAGRMNCFLKSVWSYAFCILHHAFALSWERALLESRQPASLLICCLQHLLWYVAYSGPHTHSGGEGNKLCACHIGNTVYTRSFQTYEYCVFCSSWKS